MCFFRKFIKFYENKIIIIIENLIKMRKKNNKKY